MSTFRILTAFVASIVFILGVACSGAEAEQKPARAFGDTPEFWETYALVVATVTDVKHREQPPNLVVSEVRLKVQESVPNRYKAGTEFSVTFSIDLRFHPVRDKPGYAVDLHAGDRVMLMMTEDNGKLIQATPGSNRPSSVDAPSPAIDLKSGSKDTPQVADLRGISSFAMLPGLRLTYPKEDDALVTETVRLCQALSERDVKRQLELIATIQRSNPDDRVRDLLRRRLETTLETSLNEAQKATRLLKASTE